MGWPTSLQLPVADINQVQLAALALVVFKNVIYLLALHAVAWWVFPRLRQAMPEPPAAAPPVGD